MTKKWPDLTRRVASDSFTITADGEEYHPHKGEWVLLRQRVTPAMTKAGLKFWGIQGKLTRDNASEFAGDLTELLDALGMVVLDWNWTGPDGKPYPQPSAEVMAKYLDFEELAWLTKEAQGEKAANPTSESPPS